MIRKITILSFLIGISLFSCKPDKLAELKKTSLLQYGLPIHIMAPDSVDIKKSSLGMFDDVTIKGGDSYYVQILVSDATTVDVGNIKTSLMEDIKKTPYFSKIIEEMDDGFIYEKQIDDNTNYAFRRVKVQGDREYIFQTGLIGQYSEEDVRLMYDAVE